MVQNDEIEKVLNIFSDFIEQSQTFDILKSKYGYVILLADSCKKKVYDIRNCSTAEELCDFLFEWLTMDYLYKKNFESMWIPEESELEFLEDIKKYLDQIPEYRYLLAPYLETKATALVRG